MSDLEKSEDRILRLLKFRGPQSAETIARELGISVPGARKHLQSMTEQDLLAFEDEAGAVGRPKRQWRLTETAEKRFPDSHAFLTLEMIGSIRSVFGADGLDRLIAERENQMLVRYRHAMGDTPDLEARLEKLTALRSEEGYMAEWRRLDDGSFLLAENHCPICAAARTCQGFCRSELDIFKKVLGPGARVERSEHILDGARRCAYRVTLVAETTP